MIKAFEQGTNRCEINEAFAAAGIALSDLSGPVWRRGVVGGGRVGAAVFNAGGAPAHGHFLRRNPDGPGNCGVLGDCRIADGVRLVRQPAGPLGDADCARRSGGI